MRTGIKIVHNKLLGGWFVVRGPHHFPLAGRFATKAEAQDYLKRDEYIVAFKKFGTLDAAKRYAEMLFQTKGIVAAIERRVT